MEVNKANLIISQQPIVILLLLKKIKSKVVIRTWASLSTIYIIKNVTILINILTKSQETSVGLDDIYIGD